MSRDPLADVQSPDFQLQMQLAALEWKLRQVRKRNRRARLARRVQCMTAKIHKERAA